MSELVRGGSFYNIQIQKLQETLRTAGYQQQLRLFLPAPIISVQYSLRYNDDECTEKYLSLLCYLFIAKSIDFIFLNILETCSSAAEKSLEKSLLQIFYH